MRQISSRQTWFLKRVFPWIATVVVLGCSAVIVILFLEGTLPWWGLLLALAGNSLAVGQVLHEVNQRVLRPLADRVSIDDARQELVVVRRGAEVRIPLTSIDHASSRFTNPENPEIVKLTLREPSEFGSVVKFAAPQRMVRFTENPIVTELNQRVRGDLAN